MKIIPINLLVLALLLFTSCEKNFLKVVSSSFAKEYCSCIYIEEQDPKVCETYAEQVINIDSFHHDRERKMIVAQAFGQSSYSFYRGTPLGCSLP
jgi:hypothetical protein